jgi:peptidyl-prolyl cis-trans isomerase D
LGTVTREQVLPELADAAFQLPEGGVSNLVESPLGWHLIRVTSIQPAQRRSLDEVGDQLTKELANERAIDALIDLSARLEDALAGGATLEEAASQIGLTPLKIEALDSNGLDPEGRQVENLPQGFVDTAFSTSENTESSLVEADRDGGYFVVRVDKVTPASPKPFEVARTEVEQAWAAVKRGEASEAKAKAIAGGIEKGASFPAAAAEHGLQVNPTPPISRSGEGASVDLEMALIRSAFQTQPENVFVATGQNAAFVASVTDVIAADPASEAQRFAALARDTQATEQNDLLSQLTQGLAKRHPVEINAQAVEQLY